MTPASDRFHTHTAMPRTSPMTERRFSQLDVFTSVPLRGNPLAVMHDAQGLTDAQMADIARWTNLSETTFLLPPDDAEADYRVRIFTPGGELPFAGHPTLGSCHAWLAAGGVPRDPGVVVQQCGVGRVRVRKDGDRLAFAAPALRRTGQYAAAIAAGYGLSERHQTLLRRAVPYHYIGACAVADEATAQTWTSRRQLLRQRAIAGNRVLRDHASPVLRVAAEIALARHEHWNGGGVPFGLAGEAIPLSARITALADMFDQMTAEPEPGRSALTAERAAAVIQADEAEQFDPSVVSAFRYVLPQLRHLMTQRHGLGLDSTREDPLQH